MGSLPSDDLAPTNPNQPSLLATVLLEHGHSAVCVGCLAKICASLDPIADPDLGMYLVPALKTIAGGGFSPMPYPACRKISCRCVCSNGARMRTWRTGDFWVG